MGVDTCDSRYYTYICIHIYIHISRVFLDKLMHAEGNWIA